MRGLSTLSRSAISRFRSEDGLGFFWNSFSSSWTSSLPSLGLGSSCFAARAICASVMFRCAGMLGKRYMGSPPYG